VDVFGLGVDPESVSRVSAAVVPYVVEAVRSLGARIWDRAEDAAVEGSAGWGRRLVQRLRHRDTAVEDGELVAAVEDVIAAPDDIDRHAALRVKVGKALTASPQMLAEVVELLRQAGHHAEASGDRAVAGEVTDSIVVTGERAVGRAEGPVVTGDGNVIGNWNDVHR
jgi:hypothetical protein